MKQLVFPALLWEYQCHFLDGVQVFPLLDWRNLEREDAEVKMVSLIGYIISEVYVLLSPRNDWHPALDLEELFDVLNEWITMDGLELRHLFCLLVCS